MSQRFKTVTWAESASIYEVNIRQYTAEGTFAAFSKYLSRLKDMGVDILWLMPVTPISMEERQGTLGSYYACSSYTHINPEFGQENDFHALINEAHALGMRVIIDWVANHTGFDHQWTKDHPEWYIRDAEGKFTERNGWKDVIDLDFKQEAMRSAMIDAMQYWVKEFDIDGFRCDMAHLVPLDFWLEARAACDIIKPLYWLAECEEVNYHEAFDTSYAWHWMHVTEKFVKGEVGLHQINEVLHSYTQYPPGSSKLFFTANHDENSWNGTEYEKYGLCAKAWAVFTCTWQGIPLVYSGQENPNLKRLAFFDKDQIDWQAEPALHSFYKTILHLRKTNSAILGGETFILPVDAAPVMAYFRKKENDQVLVLLNLSAQERTTINISHEWLAGKYVHLFSGIDYQFANSENFELLPGDFLVYIKKS